MHRRHFLKLVGLGSMATAMQLSVPLAAMAVPRTVAHGGRQYRCDGSSRIYVSADSGRSWALQTDLGSRNAVTRLAVDRADRLTATVAFSGWSYVLALAPNMVSWRTT